MSYKYSATKGITNIKSHTKSYFIAAIAVIASVGVLSVPTFATPTTDAVAGPGCFGKWRAGSVQMINGHAPGQNNAGALHFSERAGTNSTINAGNKMTCEKL